jgi:hypothetical protein
VLSGESIRSEKINEIVKAYSGNPRGEGCVVAGEWTDGDWRKIETLKSEDKAVCCKEMMK